MDFARVWGLLNAKLGKAKESWGNGRESYKKLSETVETWRQLGKLEIARESYGRLREAGESWRKLGKAGES